MCTNCAVTTSFDKARTEAFGQKLINTLNSGALTLMLSIGHRTGLFDAMAELPPASSGAIAEAANLNERYVREWLGAMVSSGVVDYQREQDKYSLPPEHSSLLTRAAGSDNIATLSQYIPLLGSVEDKILDCFRNGGGVPYSDFGRFHEVMADDSGQSVLPALFEHILPLIPGATANLEAGIEVADVGCGRGKALLMLAESFPQSRFTGYDISEEAIQWASKEAEKRALSNIKFVVRDAAEISDTGRFDIIFTFDAIHDQAKPDVVLGNIYRALKPGGYYLMQDIGARSNVADNINHPLGTILYTISCMHCMTVSLAAGGAGLGAVWGIELAGEMLRDAGFQSSVMHNLAHDIQNAYFVQQK